MTVQELIDALKNHAPDKEVVYQIFEAAGQGDPRPGAIQRIDSPRQRFIGPWGFSENMVVLL